MTLAGVTALVVTSSLPVRDDSNNSNLETFGAAPVLERLLTASLELGKIDLKAIISCGGGVKLRSFLCGKL